MLIPVFSCMYGYDSKANTSCKLLQHKGPLRSKGKRKKCPSDLKDTKGMNHILL